MRTSRPRWQRSSESRTDWTLFTCGSAGSLQAADHVVLDCAYAEDRVLATKNVDDFVRLARAREVHPGIILVQDGDLVRDEQLRVVRASVAWRFFRSLW
jgi:predicted nuclease of predicted toxin-antitoxin system